MSKDINPKNGHWTIGTLAMTEYLPSTTALFCKSYKEHAKMVNILLEISILMDG